MLKTLSLITSIHVISPIEYEKDDENSKSFTEKVQAGAKAVAAKINNPGTDLNLEYEKGKADEELDV